MTSLCDTCVDPGACCRSLHLSKEDGSDFTVWKDKDPLAAVTEAIGENWFFPVEEIGSWESKDTGREYVSYVWSCSALTSDGRCAVYDRRPSLCREYEPGSTRLCVHYDGDKD